MTDIAKVDPAALQPRNLKDAYKLAEMCASINYAGHSSAASALVCIIAGSERGFSAIQSLTAFHVINGKASPSADAMLALAMQSPDCEYLRCSESTPERATYVAKKHGQPEFELSFTMDEAKKAGLLSNKVWGKYPAAMLRARAGAAIARCVFPAAVHGLYIREELGGHEEVQVVNTDTVFAKSRQVGQSRFVAEEVKRAAGVQVVDVTTKPVSPYTEGTCPGCGSFTKLKAGLCQGCSFSRSNVVPIHRAGVPKVDEATGEVVAVTPDPRTDAARTRLFALMNETELHYVQVEECRFAWLNREHRLTSFTELSYEQMVPMGQTLANWSPEPGPDGALSERADFLLGMLTAGPKKSGADFPTMSETQAQVREGERPHMDKALHGYEPGSAGE